ncbi:MAG: hypothetical protein PWP42_309 [Candidatus Atribacteria bacterium]|uniref:hypothetical protein n=1 Tax=Atrimonas thermophila TaxID=3064161 RepID=UPI0024AB0403|nr:hypothetical protein [Candidatus Atribacteria bacterium]
MRTKIVVLLVLVGMLTIVLLGCGATGVISTGGSSSPPPPPSCSLRVISSCYDCWGYVWVNGQSTGQYLDYNGAVFIPNVPCGTTVSVQLVDEFANYSHVEYVVTQPGENLVNFTYW